MEFCLVNYAVQNAFYPCELVLGLRGGLIFLVNGNAANEEMCLCNQDR